MSRRSSLGGDLSAWCHLLNQSWSGLLAWWSVVNTPAGPCHVGTEVTAGLTGRGEPRVTAFTLTQVLTTELADEGGPSLMLDNVTGGHCQKKRGACDPNPCKGGGECRKIAGGFRCQCRAGRRGRLCQEEVMLADQGGEGGGGGGVRFTGNMSVRIDNRVSRR